MKPSKQLILVPLLFSIMLTGCAVQKKIINSKLSSRLLQISQVGVEPKTLNFLENSKVSLSFSLSKPANVNVQILDLGHNLINELAKDKSLSAGEHSFYWDGKDNSGNLVADGVFIYTIEAKAEDSRLLYHPQQNTYGQQLDIDKLTYDKEKGQISFVLPKTAMLSLRAGIKDGPLLNTLFDWQPEQAGRKTYNWQGLDKSGLIKFGHHPDLMFYTSAYALGDNTIIVKNSSNKNITVISPKAKEGSYLHATHRRNACHQPNFKVELLKAYPQNQRGYSLVSGQVPLRVTIDARDRDWLVGERFEIIFFVDTVFLFEDEDAATPFNYYWDTRGLNEGEHVLTVNVAGYQDHIGTESLKVEVSNIE